MVGRGSIQISAVRKPLFLELHFFVERILTGEAPIVTADDAIEAMVLVERIVSAAGDGQAMSVTVESERPVELLQRQLERLHDVLWVELKQPAIRWTGRAGARPIGGSQ